MTAALARVPGFVWVMFLIATEMTVLSGGIPMRFILILGGIALIVGGWLGWLVQDGWSAPEGRFRRGPASAIALGVAAIVAAFALV